MAITRKLRQPKTNSKIAQKVSKNSKTIAKAAETQLKKVKKACQKLWDDKKVEIGQVLSEVQYLKVEAINGDKIDFKTKTGAIWTMGGQTFLEKLAENSFSADHYDREVTVCMTELANIMSSNRGTVFKAVFSKKLQETNVQNQLAEIDFDSLSDSKKLDEISKNIFAGETREIVGYAVGGDNVLGRTHVIDLDAPLENNSRQVDHRTIQSIIIKNVKYTLGKKKAQAAAEQAAAANWDHTKIAVGNWFSYIKYYKVTAFEGDNVVLTDQKTGEEIVIGKENVSEEIHNGNVYDTVEKVCRQDMIDIMSNAKNTVMTVSFTKKIDLSYIQDILKGATKAQFENKKQLKELSKQLINGKDHKMTCYLAGEQNNLLGRSVVIDLNAEGDGYKMIDHRTIYEVIVNNTLYKLK